MEEGGSLAAEKAMPEKAYLSARTVIPDSRSLIIEELECASSEIRARKIEDK